MCYLCDFSNNACQIKAVNTWFIFTKTTSRVWKWLCLPLVVKLVTTHTNMRQNSMKHHSLMCICVHTHTTSSTAGRVGLHVPGADWCCPTGAARKPACCPATVTSGAAAKTKSKRWRKAITEETNDEWQARSHLTCTPLLQCSEVRMRPGRWEGRSRRRKYHTRFQKMMGCWLRNLWV